MLLLTHKPKPISLARQRRDNPKPPKPSYYIPDEGILVVEEEDRFPYSIRILLEESRRVSLEEMRRVREKLIESGFSRDRFPEEYLL